MIPIILQEPQLHTISRFDIVISFQRHEPSLSQKLPQSYEEITYFINHHVAMHLNEKYLPGYYY